MTVYEYLTVLTSLISVAIAFVTVLFAREELRHSRALNRPILIITQHFGGSQGRYGIAVKNAGLGPAIITRCEVLIDSNKMKENHRDHGWDAAIDRLKLKSEMELKKTIVAPAGKLTHGDRIWLMYIAEKSITDENIYELQSAIETYRLDIKIEYESLIGVKFSESFLK
jgi:hypothetical protein